MEPSHSFPPLPLPFSTHKKKVWKSAQEKKKKQPTLLFSSELASQYSSVGLLRLASSVFHPQASQRELQQGQPQQAFTSIDNLAYNAFSHSPCQLHPHFGHCKGEAKLVCPRSQCQATAWDLRHQVQSSCCASFFVFPNINPTLNFSLPPSHCLGSRRAHLLSIWVPLHPVFEMLLKASLFLELLRWARVRFLICVMIRGRGT